MLLSLDIYRILKSDFYTSNIPIFFITAVTPIAPILKAQIIEDVEVIIKPFDVTKLATRITEMCDRYYFSVP
jgi:response regulator RpfG family c-di-GMP phosphodiesterase